MRYRVIVEPSQDGGYAVRVPGLPGCRTQGETTAEALENAKDAIGVYLLTVRQILAERRSARSKTYRPQNH